jgi:hypothetical protein
MQVSAERKASLSNALLERGLSFLDPRLMPSPEVVLSYAASLLEAFLDVQFVGFRIVSVDVPKQSFEFCDFLIANVVPHLEGREMAPLLGFAPRFRVTEQPASKTTPAAGGRHAYVDNSVFLRTAVALLPVQRVNATELVGQLMRFFLFDVFSTSFH